MFGLELIVVLLAFVIPVLWIVCLVDIIKHNFTGNNKIIWLLIVLFVPLLGMILYFSIGRGQRILTPPQQGQSFSFSKVCQACGTVIEPGANFCSKCGATQKQ